MKSSDAQHAQRTGSKHSKQSFFNKGPRPKSEPFFSPNGKTTFFSEESVQQKPFFDASVVSPVPRVQTKMVVGSGGDNYEREADTVASQVVEQINASPPKTDSIQRKILLEEDKELQTKPIDEFVQRMDLPDKEDENLQMRPVLQRKGQEGGAISTDLEMQIQSAKGSGQALTPKLQAQMGQMMGVDFSGVRVHTNTQSDQMNHSLRSQAFTTGQDVFFRQGAYQPESRSGQKLIAHELTHVAQQNMGTLQRLNTSQISNRSKLQVQRKLPEVEVSWMFWAGKYDIHYLHRYQPLIENELERLEGKKISVDKEKKLYQRYKAELEGEKYSNALNTLKTIVREVNKLSPIPTEADWGTPLATKYPEKNLVIRDIIQKITKLIDEKIVNDEPLLAKFFGIKGVEIARARFKEIPKNLSTIFENEQFMADTTGSLSSQNTSALTRGVGADAKILVDPTQVKKDNKDLIVTIIHEGSHTIPGRNKKDQRIKAVIDFSYRKSWAHGYLPSDIAVKNAANYEAVASEKTGGLPENDKWEIRDQLKKDKTKTGKILALADFLITRAWDRLPNIRKGMSDFLKEHGGIPLNAWINNKNTLMIQALEKLNLPLEKQKKLKENKTGKQIDVATINLYRNEATRMMDAIRSLQVKEHLGTTGTTEEAKRTELGGQEYYILYKGDVIITINEATIFPTKEIAFTLVEKLIGKVVKFAEPEIMLNWIKNIEEMDRLSGIDYNLSFLKN